MRKPRQRLRFEVGKPKTTKKTHKKRQKKKKRARQGSDGSAGASNHGGSETEAEAEVPGVVEESEIYAPLTEASQKEDAEANELLLQIELERNEALLKQTRAGEGAEDKTEASAPASSSSTAPQGPRARQRGQRDLGQVILLGLKFRRLGCCWPQCVLLLLYQVPEGLATVQLVSQ